MRTAEDLLQTMVSIPSESGNEQRLAAYVLQFCRSFGHTAWNVNGSVAVLIRGINRRRTLILNGHLDTVPGDWPGALHMVVDEGRLRGLGVTDMKAGLAVMCLFAQRYGSSPPPCDTWLFFSKEEETTAQGSLDLVAWWSVRFGAHYTKKAVLILEPTGLAYVAFSHKGGGVYKAIVTGCGSRHGSCNLVDEVTALDRACRFGVGVKRAQQRWLARFPATRYGPATINLTRIHTPDGAPNVVPEVVEVLVDVRTNDALGLKQLTAEFRKIARSYGVVLPVMRGAVAGIVECVDTLAIKQAFAVAWPELPEDVFPAATDMNAFLWSGLPVAIVGPGNESLHQRGENISRGAMELCLDRLLAVLEAFASQD